ncbi:MAG: hypothetical protein A3I29_00955 [Candidatus Magasanikbacteria bacterium RIFCSPLOWO2_02_FULL_44_11]|uniref:AtpZ/AtpI family protein n=2 Tax=Candidatus Magasanikiibacteriota TaxID=1752731 RepID=A0A1F6N903_9BACT|nr:MAG: hypothetical protein A3D53_01610 [Candidatus Magasanikbacteria bacterium RIFCSPHIGHO2_02_FULL_45_10]OGH80399.1 MAG: hypothetical protein A3I29_00955 [Candidatus Magasanikbacteria bacterium RIFCSPLOWO2_02_FULL_44_11]
MEENPKNQSDRRYYLFAMRIVGDFGATIAIPVVALVLLGRYIDHRYNNSGYLFTLIGFAVAALVSAKIIYKKAKKYGQDYQNLK